jgi:hypothetical protein
MARRKRTIKGKTRPLSDKAKKTIHEDTRNGTKKD